MEVNKHKLYVYTLNLNDPCFEWKGPSFGGFKPQNRGQTGSRYIYIYILGGGFKYFLEFSP